jgi:hypothetical protein
LGKDLYQALKRIYPTTWGTFDSSLQSKFDTNFEDGMAHLIENNSHAIAPLMQRMAIFFSRFGPDAHSDNLYIELFKKLKRNGAIKNTLITTLNYECICELAASVEGLQIEYFGKLENEMAKIWKLHGSCNFKLTGMEAGSGVSFGHGVVFNGGIEYLNPADVPKIYNGTTALYPSMCLYAKDKPLAIAEGVIKNFQNEWAEKVKESKKIICVGVRPLEEDNHIWKPISESTGELIFTGDKAEFDTWTKKFRKGKINKYLGKYWNDTEYDIYNEL